MDYQDFVKLGFNKNEAIVLNALVYLGTCDASELIQKTKFHKNIVYDNLYKLRDKGIISTIQRDKKQYFTISNADALIDYFDQKEKEIKEKKQLAIGLSKQIINLTKEKKLIHDAAVYRGTQAIRAFFFKNIKGGESLAFGAPKESIEIMGAEFWINLNIKRVKEKQKSRMIFNNSIRNHAKELPSKLTEIRYFDGNFEPLTETFIQNDIVGIIVWSKEPVLFQIKDEHVAKEYKKYFKDLWNNAKN